VFDGAKSVQAGPWGLLLSRAVKGGYPSRTVGARILGRSPKLGTPVFPDQERPREPRMSVFRERRRPNSRRRRQIARGRRLCRAFQRGRAANLVQTGSWHTSVPSQCLKGSIPQSQFLSFSPFLPVDNLPRQLSLSLLQWAVSWKTPGNAKPQAVWGELGRRSCLIGCAWTSRGLHARMAPGTSRWCSPTRRGRASSTRSAPPIPVRPPPFPSISPSTMSGRRSDRTTASCTTACAALISWSRETSRWFVPCSARRSPPWSSRWPAIRASTRGSFSATPMRRPWSWRRSPWAVPAWARPRRPARRADHQRPIPATHYAQQMRRFPVTPLDKNYQLLSKGNWEVIKRNTYYPTLRCWIFVFFFIFFVSSSSLSNNMV